MRSGKKRRFEVCLEGRDGGERGGKRAPIWVCFPSSQPKAWKHKQELRNEKENLKTGSLYWIYNLLGILMPPSSLKTTPLSITFSMLWVTSCANSCGFPALTVQLSAKRTRSNGRRDNPTWEFHDSL